MTTRLRQRPVGGSTQLHWMGNGKRSGGGNCLGRPESCRARRQSHRKGDFIYRALCRSQWQRRC